MSGRCYIILVKRCQVRGMWQANGYICQELPFFLMKKLNASRPVANILFQNIFSAYFIFIKKLDEAMSAVELRFGD